MQKTKINQTILSIISWSIFLALSSCTPSYTYFQIQSSTATPESYEKPNIYNTGKKSCVQQANYIPDTNHIDHTPMKYVRCNFHWMNSLDSMNNFSEKEAIEYTKGFMHAVNYDLAKNRQMWLPNGNNTPVVAIRYRMVLTPQENEAGDDGIYFHYDDELYYHIHKGKDANIFDRKVINTYKIGGDSILNIFVMPQHPDSIASPTYKNYKGGVALGNAMKMTGVWAFKNSYWDYRFTINHETGHVFGLYHAWLRSDRCPDTPPHKRECYNKTDRPECDTLTSNNIMDYSAVRNAWTPHQIGRIHKKMSDIKAKARKTLQPNWCEGREGNDIIITDSIQWNCHKDIEGNLIIEKGGTLSLFCRLSIPKDKYILVKKGGKLILNGCHLHNACGLKWKGIIVEEKTKDSAEVIGDVKIENTYDSSGEKVPKGALSTP